MADKRKKQAMDMRKRILDAATELFREKNREEVSVAEIAQKAGCSPGNLYHYFTGKEELQMLSYVDVDDRYERAYQRMKNRAEFLVLEPELRYVSFQLRVVEICFENEKLKDLYLFALRNQKLAVEHLQPSRSFIRICRELIEAMIQKGRIRKGITVERILFESHLLNRGIILTNMISTEPFDGMALAGRAYLHYIMSIMSEEAKR